jgi:hypothetical protein
MLTAAAIVACLVAYNASSGIGTTIGDGMAATAGFAAMLVLLLAAYAPDFIN